VVCGSVVFLTSALIADVFSASGFGSFTPLSIRKEVVWTPETAWKTRRREKY
jgi:hypothetical protein